MKTGGAGVVLGLLLVLAIIVFTAMTGGYDGHEDKPDFPPASPGGGHSVIYAP